MHVFLVTFLIVLISAMLELIEYEDSTHSRIREIELYMAISKHWQTFTESYEQLHIY